MPKVTPQEHANILLLHAEGLGVREIARKTGRSATTVKRHIQSDPELAQKVIRKNEECVAQSMLDHMEERRDFACSLMDDMLVAAKNIVNVINANPEDYGKNLTSVLTSFGILIDKFTMTEAKQPGMRKDNNLFDAIDRSVGGAIDYSDIPEIQPPPEIGDDLVGPPGAEQI